MANIVQWSIDMSGPTQDVIDKLQHVTVYDGLSTEVPVDPDTKKPTGAPSPYGRITDDDKQEFERVKRFLLVEASACKSPRIGVYARQVYDDTEPRHGIGLQVNIAEYW